MLSIIIFLIVLFIYLHIYYQITTNDELEVLEIEKPTKEKFEKICDLKQPFVFNYHVDNKITINHENLSLNIRSVDYRNDNESLFIPFKFEDSKKLFSKDGGSYYSENNMDFIIDSKYIRKIEENDGFLMPLYNVSKSYDYLTGSVGSYTPLRYDLNFRNFYHVVSGKVQIKLIPPNYSNNLYSVYDYENFEFYSKVNPWEVQEQYKVDYNKVKNILLNVSEGSLVNIPPYWWYSIKFLEKDSEIVSFKYKTVMNNVVMLPYTFMHYLQVQNIRQKTVKTYNDFIVENDDNNNENNENNENKNEIVIENISDVNEISNETTIINL
tara:strand:+ start:827 stop:1801 length:975 start_codon:yes stop_codon:yes gene_type:complete